MSDPTATQEPEINVKVVEDLMQVLVKGLRAVQLYMPNNPVYQTAIKNLRAAFEPLWRETAELSLTVTETDLSLDGHVVLSQPAKSESIAWVLFKDGVRRLVLSPGVEDDEIVRFLNVIHKVRNLPPDADDDLLTLLWEQDFQELRYDFVELGMDEAPPLEAGESEPPPGEQVRQEVQTEAQEEEPPKGIVSVDDFDSTLYFLDDSEVQYLKSELEREYSQDLRGNVLSMLFDLMELQTYSTVRAELISIVENFIPYLLAVGDFRSVAYILKESKLVMERAREMLPEHTQALQALPDRLSDSEALSQLLQSLDEAVAHPTEEELGDLFRELRPQALTTVFQWIPKLSNARVRYLLDHAAQRLAQAHPDHLVEALEATDEQIVLQAMRVASQLKIPPVVPVLGKILREASPEARRAAVEALTAIDTPGAMQQLEGGIEDADRDVRIAVVRALAAKQHKAALSRVETTVLGRSVREADLTEKTAFFEAYGSLVGPAGIQKLKSLVETKGFMKRKEDPEIRACAAMALGKIGTAEAREVLESVAKDKEPLVRNAANRALKEIGAT